MQIALLPGFSIAVTTPTGVLYNALSASLLGSLTSLLFAMAGLTDIGGGYLIGTLYGCLLGIVFARFSMRDSAKRALYEHTFQHILRHLPSRKVSKKRFLMAFFCGCEWRELLIAVQLNFAIRDRLAALIYAIAQFNRSVADSTLTHRYFLLSNSLLTHAPPAVQ